MSTRGSTLLEVMTAIVIVCIAVMGVYTVIASSRVSHAQLDEQAAVDESLAAAADALKDYVTADTTLADMPGPGAGGSWQLPGDPCLTAFAPGCVHDAGKFISPALNSKHPAATLTYTVTPSASPQVDGPSAVTFTLDLGS